LPIHIEEKLILTIVYIIFFYNLTMGVALRTFFVAAVGVVTADRGSKKLLNTHEDEAVPAAEQGHAIQKTEQHKSYKKGGKTQQSLMKGEEKHVEVSAEGEASSYVEKEGSHAEKEGSHAATEAELQAKNEVPPGQGSCCANPPTNNYFECNDAPTFPATAYVLQKPSANIPAATSAYNIKYLCGGGPNCGFKEGSGCGNNCCFFQANSCNCVKPQ